MNPCVAVFGILRFLRAPYIELRRAIARQCGLMERKFTAYDIAGSREV